MEQTIVVIKPDGMKKKISGAIISRLENAGLELKDIKLVTLTGELLNIWYTHHKDKPFFPKLVEFMCQCPVLAMIWQGENAVAKVRGLCGPTDSLKAPKGTIRGDFGQDIQKNVVHVSDSVETAQKEKNLLFESVTGNF